MRKFRFRFEFVLKHRKRCEDEALLALARSQRAHQAAREMKVAFQQELANALLKREELGRQPVEISAFHVTQYFISGTKQRIIQSEAGIARAARGVEKALRNFLHSRRQSRMIELLREKAYADWKKELAKIEQRHIDDIVVMRARMPSIADATDIGEGSSEEIA